MARRLHSTPQLDALAVVVSRLIAEAAKEGQTLAAHYIPAEEFAALCSEYKIPDTMTLAVAGVPIYPYEVMRDGCSEEAKEAFRYWFGGLRRGGFTVRPTPR